MRYKKINSLKLCLSRKKKSVKLCLSRLREKPLCGSVVDPNPHGSAFIWLSWIRIRMGNADLDPGAWKLTKFYKHIRFSAFKKGFYTFVVMVLTYYLHLVYF